MASFVALLALAAPMRRSRAQATGAVSADLRHVAAQGCPDAAAFAAAVAARGRVELAQSADVDGPRVTVVFAPVTNGSKDSARAGAQRFSGRVLIDIPGAAPLARAFEGETCAAVANALALVVALSLDPRGAATPRAAPAAGIVAAPARSTHELSLRPGVRRDLGGAAGQLFFGWRYTPQTGPSVGLGVGGMAASPAGTSVRVASAALRPDLCIATAIGPTVVLRPLCLGADVGLVTAHADGVADARWETRPFVTALASTGARWLVSRRWFLEATADVGARLMRQRYVLNGEAAALAELSAVTFGVAVGGGIILKP